MKAYVLFAISAMLVILIAGCIFPENKLNSPDITAHRMAVLIPSDYKKYVNEDMQFSIYIPQDWQVVEVSKDELSVLSSNEFFYQSTMPEIVYFFDTTTDPSQSLFFISGSDFTQSAMGSNNIQNLNDGFVTGSRIGMEKDNNTNITVKSKGVPYLYGNEEGVSNVLTYTTPYGLPSTMETTLIKKDAKIYVLIYVATDEMYKKKIMTIETIIHTFSTDPVSLKNDFKQQPSQITVTPTLLNCTTCGGKSYCDAEGECCKERWYSRCPLGYYLGDDCTCHVIHITPGQFGPERTPSKYITITPDPTAKLPPSGRYVCNIPGYYCPAGSNCCATTGICYAKCSHGVWSPSKCVCLV